MNHGRTVGILTTDLDLHICSWDAFLEEITGISAATVCGRHLSVVIPDLHSRGLAAVFQRVVSAGSVEILTAAPHHYLIPAPPRSPNSRFTQMQQTVRLSPLREGADVVGVMVTIEDVTARLEKEALTQSFSEDDWQRRRETVNLLAGQNNPGVITELLRALQDEHRNPGVLNSALEVLRISDWDTITPLAGFLKDGDPELRAYAALALGESKEERAIAPLIGALKDEDINVRYHAIEALGKLKAQDSIDELTRIAKSRDFFLSFPAIDALTTIGNPDVAIALLPLLEDELLQLPVIQLLGRLGGEDAVAHLARLLSALAIPAEYVASALADIHDRYERQYGEGQHIADLTRTQLDSTASRNLIDALDRVEGASLRALALVMGWSTTEVVADALIRLLGVPVGKREIVEAIVRFGGTVTDRLLLKLDDSDVDVRQAAISALGRIGDRKAVPRLIEALADPDLTVVTSGALATIGDSRAYETLLEFLGDEEPAVRQAAIAALNSIGHPSMASRVRELLESPDPRMRESAVRIAGYFGYLECVDPLLKLTQDPDIEVRRAVIEILPFLDNERATNTLMQSAKTESGPLRAAAVRALAHVERDVAGPLLLDATQDCDAWVRYYAVRSLAFHRLKGVEGVLAKLKETDPAPQVRIAAAEAVAAIQGN